MGSAVSRLGCPEKIEFATKPAIALEQIRQAMEQKVPAGVVLADAGYGNSTPFREAITELGLSYMCGHRFFHYGLGTGAATLASTATETRPRVGPQTPAAQCGPSAPFGEAVGLLVTGFSVEGDRLAPRQPGNFALSIRRGPRAPSPPRL